MEHFKQLLAPFIATADNTIVALLVVSLNFAYFFGLMFGTLSILQHFGIV